MRFAEPSQGWRINEAVFSRLNHPWRRSVNGYFDGASTGEPPVEKFDLRRWFATGHDAVIEENDEKEACKTVRTPKAKVL